MTCSNGIGTPFGFDMTSVDCWCLNSQQIENCLERSLKGGLEVVPLGVTKGYRLKHGVGAHPRHTWTLHEQVQGNVRACTRPSA